MEVLAKKLNCENDVITRSKQYLQKLQSLVRRQGGNSIANIHCYREIACLDLASQALGRAFDRQTAISLSQKSETTSRQTQISYDAVVQSIRALLDIKTMGLQPRELAIKFGFPLLGPWMEEKIANVLIPVFQSCYVDSLPMARRDALQWPSHPQFMAAFFFLLAEKSSKTKGSGLKRLKSALASESHVSASQFDNLISLFLSLEPLSQALHGLTIPCATDLKGVTKKLESKSSASTLASSVNNTNNTYTLKTSAQWENGIHRMIPLVPFIQSRQYKSLLSFRSMMDNHDSGLT